MPMAVQPEEAPVKAASAEPVSTQPVSTDALRSTAAILKATHKAVTACGRPDLMVRIDQANDRLATPNIAAVVLGEFKQGKSSLINALLNAPVCPVDDDVATAVVTVIHHADQPQAVALVVDSADTSQTVAVPLAVGSVAGVVLSGALKETSADVHTVEFGLPRRLLQTGLRLVDTPGVGGMESAHGKATIGVLPLASAALFVTDASQELTRTELDVLHAAHERCHNIVCVLSKTDLYPKWRDVAARNRTHLDAAGLDCPILPLSSTLRALSITRDDQDLHDESGFGALVAHLHHDVVARADQHRVRAALREASNVVAQLAVVIETERAVLRDPATLDQLVDQAVTAEHRASGLRSATARWNTALNDGISDLTAAVEHDLRLRMRSLVDEIDLMIDDGDPTEIADELVPLVEARLMSEIAANHELIRTTASDIAGSVADMFEQELPQIQAPQLSDAASELKAVGQLEVSVDDRPGSLASLLTGMRGSYGGMVMFGGLVSVVGNVLSAAALGPMSLVVGAALGRKAATEERKRQLAQRRQQAKRGCKKHVDAVQLRVAKHGRDTVRAVHRELRDNHLRQAKEVAKTATESARVARRAAETTGAANVDRLKQLDRVADGLTGINTAIQRTSVQ